MLLPMEGGCECGATRYEITGEPVIVYVCHCTTCQTQSGSAFGMAARFLVDDFRLTKGTLSSFQRPGTQGHTFTNSFCPKCGTRIHHVTSRFPLVVSLKPGTLDDTSWLRPTDHLFTRSAQPWVKIPDDAEAHEGRPTDLSRFGDKKA